MAGNWDGPIYDALHQSWYSRVIQQEKWKGKRQQQSEDSHSKVRTMVTAEVLQSWAIKSTGFDIDSIWTEESFITTTLSWLEDGEGLLNDKAVCQYGNGAQPVQNCTLEGTPLTEMTNTTTELSPRTSPGRTRAVNTLD